tara:strand:+ start:47 stop:673 length:627 start_codon:yes stop_codon:yes gene_type:complete
MTITNSYTRQPTKFDYAEPTKFKFTIIKLPKVEFFVTTANLPGISLGVAEQITPLKDIPLPGDRLQYDTLNIQFLVDENLENYREIHGWLTGVGFPKNYEQFQNVQGAATDRFPTTENVGTSKELGAVKKSIQDEGGLYSDATLFVLTSKNNSNLEVRFRDLYPISLSGLDFNQQATDVNYLTASVTFEYKIYEFANVGGSATIETTS